MYGRYPEQKVRAQRNDETVERLRLDPKTYREWRRDDLVPDDTPMRDPVRFGLSGSFEVIQGEVSQLVTDEGAYNLY